MVSEAIRIGPGSSRHSMFPRSSPGILVSESRPTHRNLCIIHPCCQMFGLATEVNR